MTTADKTARTATRIRSAIASDRAALATVREVRRDLSDAARTADVLDYLRRSEEGLLDSIARMTRRLNAL